MNLKDVAALAGVSLGSASRALNGAGNISPDILRRVQEASTTLGYRPNHAARALRSRSTRTVGCMVSDIANPLYGRLFRTLEDRLAHSGYLMLVSSTANELDRERRTLSLFAERAMDAVIIAPGHERNAGLNAQVAALPMPVISLDRDLRTAAASILFEHREGLQAVVEYLASLGHRRLSLIAAGLRSRPGRERLRGFRQALRLAGLPSEEDLLVLPSTSMSPVFDEVRALLSRPDRPTGLIVQGTNILSSTLNAISHLGLRIPEDVSLVTIGCPDFARYHVPAFTTLRVDAVKLSDEIAEQLLARLADPGNSPRLRHILPLHLDQGASCAPPRRTKPANVAGLMHQRRKPA